MADTDSAVLILIRIAPILELLQFFSTSELGRSLRQRFISHKTMSDVIHAL